jgi:myo-inositol catabolism protein IolH
VKIALDPTPFHRSHRLLEFEFFGVLKEIGFLDRNNTVMSSSAFAGDVSRYQPEALRQYIQKVTA